MITKKEIKDNTYVTRLAGFSPRYKYFYQNDKFQFSAQTDQQLEVWDKSFKGEYDEYPGTYFDAPKNKADFIDFVYKYLNN